MLVYILIDLKYTWFEINVFEMYHFFTAWGLFVICIVLFFYNLLIKKKRWLKWNKKIYKDFVSNFLLV